MHRIVRSWDSEQSSLVEDEDGIRILVVPTGPVSPHVYRQAIDDGAQGIYVTDNARFMTAEVFAEHRIERSDGAYEVPDNVWAFYLGDRTEPSYVDLEASSGAPTPVRPDGYVNLHTHGEFSPLDGFGTLDEIVSVVVEDGQPALAFTDHGTCAGHPALQAAATKHGFTPIFGLEAYFVEDRFDKSGKATDYWHLTLWALDDAGLRNLWAMSTEAYRDGLRGEKYPALDWDTLERLGAGVAAGTGCLGGPIAQPLMGGDEEDLAEGDPDLALSNLSRLKAIFGDRLYAELHTGDSPVQREVNAWLVKTAPTLDVPLLAVSDAHYARPSDKHAHRHWVAVQIHKEVGDDTSMFEHDTDLHVHTADQARAALAYLGEDVATEAVAETVRLASRCTAEIVPRPSMPLFSKATPEHPDRAEHDVMRLLELCESHWSFRTEGKREPQQVYLARFEREFDLLVRKGFCGYFLMVAEQVNYAKDNGVAVGPGRGSGGGSLVAYLAGITEVDPVEHDLLFERFMTEGRTALPDFDIDYPSNKKHFMLDFVSNRWGADRVVTVGTHLRLQNKGAVRDTAQAMADSLPENYFYDMKKVSDLIKEAEIHSAGLGISWDELWTEHGEALEPYRAKYPDLFDMAAKLHGRIRAYGRHAAGVVIDPDHSIENALPLRTGEIRPDGTPGPMVTQFDMEALDWMGYIKFDFLNVTMLDKLQYAAELILRDYGRWIDFRTWREEYEDPEVYDNVSAGWTLGIFQVERPLGTRMIKKIAPATLSDWADVIALGRPGPMNSGLTDEYIRRRNGESEVTYDDPRLESVLAKTYGLMIYQEDVMAVCMVLAGYDSNEADAVRKILGKKQVEKANEAGRKFIARAIENGTDSEVAEHLWRQMAEFAKYSFNRAHAFSYAVVGYRAAWMKEHYAVPTMCSFLTYAKDDRIGDFVEEARRLGIQVRPPDINLSKKGFTCDLEAVRYGIDSIKGIGAVAADAVIAVQPVTSYADFDARRDTEKCKSNIIKLLVRIGAFDTLEPNRRGLEAFIEAQGAKSSSRCRWLDPTDPQDIGLPCGYDWANEPREYGRATKAALKLDPNAVGKPKKAKPIPAKCSRACRQFDPTPPPSPDQIEPYTDGDIGAIETEMLGVRLSTSEFDRIPPAVLAELASAQDVLTGPEGYYDVAALIRSFRLKRGGDRNGNAMGWLSLTTREGSIEAVVFSSKYEKYESLLSHRGLVFAVLRKTDRGAQLDEMVSAD